MKLAYGYLMSFLLMTAIGTAICFAIVALFGVGLPMFITWSLSVAPIQWLLILRVSVAAGMFLAVWFVCSAEGKEMAEDYAGYSK